MNTYIALTQKIGGLVFQSLFPPLNMLITHKEYRNLNDYSWPIVPVGSQERPSSFREEKDGQMLGSYGRNGSFAARHDCPVSGNVKS